MLTYLCNIHWEFYGCQNKNFQLIFYGIFPFCLQNTDFGQTLEQPQGAWLERVPTIFVLINNLKIQCISSINFIQAHAYISSIMVHEIITICS